MELRKERKKAGFVDNGVRKAGDKLRLQRRFCFAVGCHAVIR
jgi:hypothetical protein